MFVLLVFLTFLMIMILFMVVISVSKFSMIFDSEVSPYECGFDSVMGSRVSFSYRFFLISILFLIFDVEVTLLIPVPFMEETKLNVIGILFFMAVLWLGLVYEYYNGVLLWLS